MELTEEHIARSLANVSDERRAKVLETFRELERRNNVLKQDIDFFRTNLASMGVGGVLASFVETPHKHMTLNPALWSTLPLEILQLVFAHLPLIDIIRLRALSTIWDRFVVGDIPGFTKVCAEVNPKLFGMVGDVPEDHPVVDIQGMAAIVIHDAKTWYRFSHVCRIDAFIDTMRAGDGGLVCIASLGRDTQQHPRIVVFNPLTGKERELPKLPHALRSVQPCMLQVVMDRDSNSYKVIVVCPKKARVEGVAASVYCSVTGRWESAMPSEGLVFGYQYKWDQEYSTDDDTWYISSRLPCAYDCANGKLLDLDDRTSPWRGADPSQYALVKDRLFVLHKEAYPKTSLRSEYPSHRYCVCEYQAQRSRPHWVKVGSHRCREFEYVPNKAEYDMHLYACKGSLLVTANNGEGRGFQHDLAWVYDLCSGKWQAISGLTERETEREDLAMFELQWDAIP